MNVTHRSAALVALVGSVVMFFSSVASGSLFGTSMTIAATSNSLDAPNVGISVFVSSVPDDGSVIWDFSLFDISVTDEETINVLFPRIVNPDVGLIFTGLNWEPIQGTISAVEVVASDDFNSSTSIEWTLAGDRVSVYFGDRRSGDVITANSYVDIVLTVHHVPEPAGGLMLLVGAAICVSHRRRHFWRPPTRWIR